MCVCCCFFSILIFIFGHIDTFLLCDWCKRLLSIILVSLGCCNRSPQTWWFTTAGIYPLTVVEARSPESPGRATLPLKAPGENPSFPPPASGSFFIPWLVDTSLQSLLLLLCLLKGHFQWIKGPVWAHLNLYLNYICQDSTAKLGYNLRLWVDMNQGEGDRGLYNPL